MLVLPADLALQDAFTVVQRMCGEMRGAQGSEVAIEAQALRNFDTSALAVLLECRREARRLNKSFRLLGAPPKLLALADLYGVRELLGP